jgi:hypothetical protein
MEGRWQVLYLHPFCLSQHWSMQNKGIYCLSRQQMYVTAPIEERLEYIRCRIELVYIIAGNLGTLSTLLIKWNFGMSVNLVKTAFLSHKL